jgi:HTH-type transcriptional regulator, competence development regulator
MKIFGQYIRDKRETLCKSNPEFSLRKLAFRIGVEPSYLSRIERGIEAPPSEAKITALANELGEDPDVLLALAGKISKDLQEAIRNRPQLFAQLIRQLKDMPDKAVSKLVREVRDGKW